MKFLRRAARAADAASEPAGSLPSISIVVATYNWSSALNCALRSIQLQTFRDFEVLVVGDGCTDDSESVVRSLNDPRFKWHNLPQNYGSQYAPNNRGLELAKANWVAYLGQDDIWHPRHLEACLYAATEKRADFVASVCIMYGPPGSCVRSITGLFVDGEYSRDAWMPPSSWMHKKSLLDRTGYWKAPEETALPVDCTFLTAAIEGGARIVSTDELTVFKFNAAWRRDSYRVKSIAEQRAVLAQIEGGIDFRQDEWREIARAFLGDRHVLAFMPPPVEGAGLRYHQLYRRHKGAEVRYSPTEIAIADEIRRFRIEESPLSLFFEWHAEETNELYGAYRWSGPLPRATASFPVRFDRALAVKIHIVAAIEPAAWDSLKIFLQGTELAYVTHVTPQGTRILTGMCRPAPEAESPEPVELTFEVGRTRRPLDVSSNKDRRWLGVAVNWVEIGPAEADDAGPQLVCGPAASTMGQ